jgi:hypothetical protein
MDKSTYLKRLETALREKYPEPQIRDILADYEDFFATGAAEGKSEAELCTEFGLPEQAACELKSESADETPRRQSKRLVLSRIVLVLLIAAILLPWLVPQIHISATGNISHGPVNFWIAMLFPLALEAILALWPSQNAAPKKALNWVPRVTVIFAVLAVIDLILFIYLDFSISQAIELFDSEGPSGRTHFLMAVTYCGSVICGLLLFVSVLSLMLYAMRGHEKANWFLLLDTALLTLLLNFNSLLSQIGQGSYNAVTGTASCFLWAILPNLAAMGITWAVRKFASARHVRRAKAWTDK